MKQPKEQAPSSEGYRQVMAERRIALVTDSTASLDPSWVAESGVTVVPVQVIIGATVYDDGDATPEMVAAALKEWTPVSTSRPNPATFIEAYEKAAAAGATEVLSIHISGELSGTVESARLAAREVDIKVTVLDSLQSAFALGYAVEAAAGVIAAGGSVRKAVNAAKRSLEGTQTIFYVDTLEYLRRGGRVTAVAALIGGALAVKPLLRLHDGKIESFEKVRTAGKALARVEELAVAHATALGDDVKVVVTVGHLASPDRAKALADKITNRLGERLAEEVVIGEIGAVLGAHVGPGMIAAVVAPAR